MLSWGLSACQSLWPKKSVGSYSTQPGQPVAFPFLKLNARLQYQDTQGSKQQARIQVRMHRDRCIWFHITTPLGVGVARVMATPTDITIIDYLRRTYTVQRYDVLSQTLGLPCTYALLQALLLGELPRSPTLPASEQHHGPSDIIYKQQHNDWQYTGIMDRAVGKLAQLVITHSTQPLQGTITYQDFVPHKKAILYSRATICLPQHTRQHLAIDTIQLTHVKVCWPIQPLQFPFKIPSTYTLQR